MIEQAKYFFSRYIRTIVGLAFVIWAALFIYRSSFVTFDGERMFCLFDDAMISMRYAWNLAHGNGLVWNPGEYVEGYTNLLWTLYMAFINTLFVPKFAVLFIQITGVVLMVLIAILTARITAKIFKDNHTPSIAVLVFIGTLGIYPLAYWALMGMETSLLTVLLLTSILLALTPNITEHRARLMALGFLLGLAYLTRPDSILFAVVIYCYLLSQTPHQYAKKKYFLRLSTSSLLIAVFIIGQLTFRYLYYHQIFPNTYILKVTGFPLDLRLVGGIGFIKPFMLGISPIIAVIAIGLWLRPRKELFLLASLFVISTSYQVFVGGDPWPYWRIIAPTLPLLLILFVASTYYTTNRLIGLLTTWPLSTKRLRGPPSSAWLFVILLPWALIINWQFREEALLIKQPYQALSNARNVNTAKALANLTDEKATVGVFWAGSVPYFTKRYAIDFLGKTDPFIARLRPDVSGAVKWHGMISVPGHNKYDLNYSIKRLQPTYIENDHWGQQDLTAWVRKHYVRVKYKGMVLILKKGSPHVYWQHVKPIRIH